MAVILLIKKYKVFSKDSIHNTIKRGSILIDGILSCVNKWNYSNLDQMKNGTYQALLVFVCFLYTIMLVAQNERDYIFIETYMKPKMERETYSRANLLRVYSKKGLPRKLQEIMEKNPAFYTLDSKNYIFYKNDNIGMMDTLGIEIHPAEFTNIKQHFGKNYLVEKNKKWGVLDKNFKTIIPCQYDDLYNGGSQYGWMVKENGQWGSIDKELGQTIPCVYDDILFLNDSIYIAVKDSSKVIIDRIGRILHRLGMVEHQVYKHWNRQYVFLRKGKKLGLVNATGKLIFPIEYDQIKPYHNKYGDRGISFILEKEGKQGLGDDKGEILIPIEYDKVYTERLDFKPKYDFAIVEKNKQEGILLNTRFIFPFKLDKHLITEYGYDLIYTRLNKKGIVVYKSGKIIKPLYQDIYSFRDTCFGVQQKGLWGVMNDEGKVIIPIEYEDIKRFRRYYSNQSDTDLFFLIQKKGLWGIVNQEDKMQIEPLYQKITFLSDELYKAQKNGLWGLISNKGKVITDFQYEEIPTICVNCKETASLISVVKDGKYGYIDAKGKEVIEIKYHELSRFNDGLAKAMINYKYGCINVKGKVVVPLEYEDAIPYAIDSIKVKLDGKSFYIDQNGKCIENCD